MNKVEGQAALEAAIAHQLQSLNVTPALLRGAEASRAYAIDGINSGGVPGEEHVPSNPGEMPNTDTSRLVESAGTESLRRNRADMYFDAEYAEPLEYGTEHMQPRPYMRPTFHAVKGDVVRDVIEETQRSLGPQRARPR